MKLQVNVSDEMVVRIDRYAKSMGVSRSSLCAMLIGQGIMSFDKSMDLLSVIGDKVGDGLLAESTLKEMGKEINEK